MGDHGAFGGGGFVNSQVGGGGDGGPSPGEKGGKGGGGGRADSVIPVTIKALTEALAASAAQDSVVIWGAELGNVTLVAKIVAVLDSATQVTYTLSDGTGRIETKMWIETDDLEGAAQTKAELQVGVYVRTFGTLKSFQGTKSLVSYSIRLVEDPNEITFHQLEVIFVSKQLTMKHLGGAPVTRAPGGAGGGGAPISAPPAHGYGGGGGQYTNQYAPQQGGGMGGGMGGGGMGAPHGGVSGNVAADVMAVFNSPMGRDDKGVSLQTVASVLGGKYSAQAIRAAVDNAVTEGELYSTVDDSHFKSTAF